MPKRFLLIGACIVVCLAGCPQSYKEPVNNAEVAPGDCTVVIEHLQNAHLPALESVTPWQNEYGPGLKLATAHYEIFTTFLEPLMLYRVPEFVESAYLAYCSLIDRPVRTTAKLKIYLFANRWQWQDFTETFAGSQVELFLRIKAGGYYLNDACVTYYIGADRTLSVLGHEGWHQFVGRHFKYRLPSWLDEGIAMAFETSRYHGGKLYFEPGINSYRLETLGRTLIQGAHIPLRELIAMNPGDVLAMDRSEAVQAFYSQSYALIRFLQEADRGRYLDNFHLLLSDGLTGNWPLSQSCKTIAADRNIPRTIDWNRKVGPQLFEQYINNDINQAEKEYLAFCLQIVNYTEFRTQD